LLKFFKETIPMTFGGKIENGAAAQYVTQHFSKEGHWKQFGDPMRLLCQR
jgi:hypothetical protein